MLWWAVGPTIRMTGSYARCYGEGFPLETPRLRGREVVRRVPVGLSCSGGTRVGWLETGERGVGPGGVTRRLRLVVRREEEEGA